MVEMQIPNISLAYLVAELAPTLEGSIVRKVQELENGWLKFRLQTRQGTKDLIAAPDALFATSFSIPAKQETSGYGAFLRKKLSNKKILSFKQQGLDRIIAMRLEGFFLIFELFAKGNVVLADENMLILSAYRKEQWKDRTLRKGEQYKGPSSKGISPQGIGAAELGGILNESDSDLVRTLVKGLNIAPVFAEAACLALSSDDDGLGKEMPAKALSGEQTAKLAAEISGLYSVDLKKERPAIAEKDGKKMLLPFLPSLPGLVALQSFPSLNGAIDAIYSKSFSESAGEQEKTLVSKKKGELEHSMRQQKEALEMLAARAENNAKKAELIYANYPQLFALQEALRSAKKQNQDEKEVMYTLKKLFPFLKSVALRQGKAVVSLEE
jgi:predicted ribosome quality control (RQC) complex YloA/Tae2 family protein